MSKLQVKEQTTEHGLATKRFINKNTLIEIVKVFKKNGKKSFFNTLSVDGYKLVQNIPGNYMVKDENKDVVLSFDSSGIVMTTDKNREQMFLDFLEVYKIKQELENTLDNKEQVAIRKLKI